MKLLTYSPVSPYQKVSPAFWLNGAVMHNAVAKIDPRCSGDDWQQKVSHYTLNKAVEAIAKGAPIAPVVILDGEYADPKFCPPDVMRTWIAAWLMNNKTPVTTYGMFNTKWIAGTSERREDWIAESKNRGSQPLILQTLQYVASVHRACNFVNIEIGLLGRASLARDIAYIGAMASLIRREYSTTKFAPSTGKHVPVAPQIIFTISGLWGFNGVYEGVYEAMPSDVTIQVASAIKAEKPAAVLLFQPMAGRDDLLVNELAKAA